MTPSPAVSTGAFILVTLLAVAAGAGWWLFLVRPERARRAAERARRLAWRGTTFGLFLDAHLFPGGPPGQEEPGTARAQARPWVAGGLLFGLAPWFFAGLLGSDAVALWWLLAATCGWWAGVLAPAASEGAPARPVAWLPLGLHGLLAVTALGALLGSAGASDAPGDIPEAQLTAWGLLGLLGAVPVGVGVLWVAASDSREGVGEEDDAGADDAPFAGFETIPPAPLREVDALLRAELADGGLDPLADGSWEDAVPWETEDDDRIP
jgi:hypothetical protein